MPKEKELAKLIPNRDVARGFLALYAGAHSPSMIWPNGGIHCGKAECEWIWPSGWEQLRDAGLIQYEVKDFKCHDGDIMKEVHWNTTPRGDALRDDWWK